MIGRDPRQRARQRRINDVVGLLTGPDPGSQTGTVQPSILVGGTVGQVLATKYRTVVEVITDVGDGTWTCPTGVTAVTIETWGAGGGGDGGGGGGGAYATGAVSVIAGNSYPYHNGAGGATAQDGENTTWNTTGIIAAGGKGANGVTGGAGGLAADCTGTTKRTGGTGGDGSYVGGNSAQFDVSSTWTCVATTVYAQVWGNSAPGQNIPGGNGGGGGGYSGKVVSGLTLASVYDCILGIPSYFKDAGTVTGGGGVLTAGGPVGIGDVSYPGGNGSLGDGGTVDGAGGGSAGPDGPGENAVGTVGGLGYGPGGNAGATGTAPGGGNGAESGLFVTNGRIVLWWGNGNAGGGGGSSAETAAPGVNGSAATINAGGLGGIAPSGGGNGGDGGYLSAGCNGLQPGGGGGGGGGVGFAAGAGAPGMIRLTYLVPDLIADWTSNYVSSVTNYDGTLTIAPNTGDVIASLNLSHANLWLAQQSFTKLDVALTVDDTFTMTLEKVVQ